MYGKDWKDSEFKKVVRISEEDLEYLKKIKDKKTIAGMLHFIITKFRKNETPQRKGGKS
jgi:hypothetical protein